MKSCKNEMSKKSNFNKSKKAQIGLEAIASISLLLFLFLGMYLIYLAKDTEIIVLRERLDEREDCLKLANTINNAYSLGDYVEITVQITENITIEPGQQRIYSENSFCTIPLRTISQNSSLTYDSFTLQPGNMTITNDNGLVIVNNG
ncbi:MAG: hypothetical protein ABH824_02600 [Nanoarchaeota archaeon]